MFRKTKPTTTVVKTPSKGRQTIPSIVTQDMHVLGNIISDGTIDFNGSLDGNIRCDTLTIRTEGSVKGEVAANSVFIYGKVKGLIRAKNVQLHAGCNVEGIIMHEAISIEDGAIVDGKFKRTDRVQTAAPETDDTDSYEDDMMTSEDDGGEVKMLENIRLIR